MSKTPAVIVARRYARGSTVAAVVIAACWHIGYDLTVTVTGWSSYRWPTLVGAAWLVYLVIGAVGAVTLFDRRWPGLSWVLAALALVVDAAVLAACQADQIVGAANWGWGSIGWLGIILLWWRRPAELLAFLAANAVIMVVGMASAGVLDRVSVARFAMVLLGSVILQLGYSVSAHALDGAASKAASNWTDRVQADHRRTVAEAVHAARIQRLQALRHDTIPLLDQLAGGADPSDATIQHRCRAGAARLRRLLAETDDVPDPLLNALQIFADLAERRGVEVSLVAHGAVPLLDLSTQRALTEAPIAALSGARTYARVTVICTATEVVVSVVADTPYLPPYTTDGVKVTVLFEGDQLWVETQWPAG